MKTFKKGETWGMHQGAFLSLTLSFFLFLFHLFDIALTCEETQGIHPMNVHFTNIFNMSKLNV
jgi:hypothetical protein